MKQTSPSYKTKLVAAIASVAVVPFIGFAETAGEGDSIEQIKTLRGRAYQRCNVLKVDPDGVTVRHAQGIAKIPFADLDNALQEKFGYDKEKEQEFYKKHEEAAKKRLEEAKKKAMVQRIPAWGQAAPAFYGGGIGYASTSDLAYYFPRAFVYNELFGQGKTSPLFGYPSLSYQLSPERRLGNPVAPSLVGSERSLQQQTIYHQSNGIYPYRIPTAQQRISATNPYPYSGLYGPRKGHGMRPGHGGGHVRPPVARPPMVRPTPRVSPMGGGIRGVGGGMGRGK